MARTTALKPNSTMMPSVTPCLSEDFRTLRFQATQVMKNLEGVGIAILAHLATPDPTLPNRGEGAPKAEAKDFCSLPLVGRARVGEHGA